MQFKVIFIIQRKSLENEALFFEMIATLLKNDSLCFLSLHPSGPSRQAWALVSVVGGGNTSCSEDVREHENHDTGGRALARRNFTTVDGVGFSVTAYSEWKNGEKRLMIQHELNIHGSL